MTHHFALLAVDLVGWPHKAQSCDPLQYAYEDYDWDTDATGTAADLIREFRLRELPIGFVHTKGVPAGPVPRAAQPSTSLEFAQREGEAIFGLPAGTDCAKIGALVALLGRPQQVVIAGIGLGEALLTTATSLARLDGAPGLTIISDAAVLDPSSKWDAYERVNKVAALRPMARMLNLVDSALTLVPVQ